MQEYIASAPEGRNYEQLLLQFRPFRAVCLLCIYIALTDYAIQFHPFRALRAETVFDLLSYKQLSLLDKREYPNGGGSLTENTSKSSNSSGLTATSSSRGGALVTY
jgi:hypothetical protein